MVDLAKIRKKAKKGNAPAEESAGGEQRAATPPAEPAAPAPLEVPVLPAPVETPAQAGGEEAGVPKAAEPTQSKLDAFKEQAGKRRQAEASRVEADEQARVELLTFVIAGEQYAVDIERIVEIVTPRAITRIPNADVSVVGIISLRGTIVTLVDVHRKLGHQPAGAVGDDTRVVVIDFHNEMIGFVVDRVLRVVKTVAGEIEPHPVVHATELDESIRGVFRTAGALTILLDLDKLLDHRWI